MIDIYSIEFEAARFELVVVATQAILIDQGALRGDRGGSLLLRGGACKEPAHQEQACDQGYRALRLEGRFCGLNHFQSSRIPIMPYCL